MQADREMSRAVRKRNTSQMPYAHTIIITLHRHGLQKQY